jgi:hypothetical protein
MKNAKTVAFYAWNLSQAMVSVTDYGHPERAFFKNPKLLGLGRQIGLKFFEAFRVFSAKLSALFWHCESLVHRKCIWFFFLQKTLVFRSKTYNSQITPKYDIGRKEFGKEPSHFRLRWSQSWSTLSHLIHFWMKSGALHYDQVFSLRHFHIWKIW